MVWQQTMFLVLLTGATADLTCTDHHFHGAGLSRDKRSYQSDHHRYV